MSKIKELEEYIEKEGITQISGGIFKEQTRRRLVDIVDGDYIYKSYTVQPNTTVAKYCEEMGKITSSMSMGYHGNEEPISGEEYAKELLGFMSATTKNIVGECRKCFKFLVEFEDDNHEEFCNGIGSQPVEYFLPKKGDTSGNLREVESVEEVGELARESGARLKAIFKDED